MPRHPLPDLIFSLFLGLAVIGSFLPWGAPGFWLGAAVLLAGALWIQRRAEPVSLPPALGWVALALVFYFLCYALATAYHADRLSLLDKPVRFALLAILVLSLPRLAPRGAVFVGALVVAGVVALAWALFDLLFNNAERVGMFINPIQFGVFSMTVAVMAAVLASRLPARRMVRVALLAGSASACVAALLTGSLTVVTAALAMPISLLVLRVPRSTPRSRAAVLGTALLAATLLGAGAHHMAEKAYKAVEDVDMFLAGEPDTSQGARIANFLNSWTLYQSSPVMGVGVHGFESIRREMAANGQLARYAASFEEAHNEYMDTLAKRGLPGIAGLMLLLLTPLWAFRRLHRDSDAQGRAWAVAGFAAVLVFALACATQNVISFSRGVNMLLAAMAMALAMASRSRTAPAAPAN